MYRYAYTLYTNTLNFPKKCGELIANLHNLLVTKIVQKSRNGEPVNEKKMVTKGLLIDRLLGVVECHVSISLSSTANDVEVNIFDVHKHSTVLYYM